MVYIMYFAEWYSDKKVCVLAHIGKPTEALKGHRVLWKIEICYLIRMTQEWKRMSSGRHNYIVVIHPDDTNFG